MIRKTILFAALLISLSFADSWGQDWKSILNGIAKTAIGDNATSEYSIIGTWNYKGASSQFDSDNLLAQAGGAAATSKINTEIAKIYSKIYNRQNDLWGKSKRNAIKRRQNEMRQKFFLFPIKKHCSEGYLKPI